MKESIRRDEVDLILKYLHFTDNENSDDDTYFKVRLLFNAINKTFKSAPLSSLFSIDESMIRYYGKHGTKQFIKGKPIRYGYKMFSVCSPEGYLYHAEPYCGASTDFKHFGLG